MESFEEMQAQLVSTYEKWWSEISQLGFDDDRYSNPFYCGIPKNWVNSNIRIMICGEEGYGCWNKELSPLDIIELQKHNLDYVSGKRKSGNVYTNKSSQFWRRVKQIEFLQEDLNIEDTENKVSLIPIIWNDCDKICKATGVKNGKLSSRERGLLHSVDTKLLRKEIEITMPTHLVFLGWYTESLKANSVYFYDKPEKKESGYNYPLDIKVATLNEQEIKVYYLYHPAMRKNRELYNKDIKTMIDNIKADIKNY